MESIYDWLLHNIGNEGNYLTILNVERHQTEGDVDRLDVMARTQDFNVLNLLIEEGSLTNESSAFKERVLKESFSISDTDQVITYLSTGKLGYSPINSGSPAFHLFVLEPAGESGSISFPPNQ
ncbi:hypothetical protein [Spirosoma foliorum]|uniref:Uncharacterized protein n=1 Tax=Spirosoma foliorum TaxID=2710596 RepID=A0A7G5H6M4_9BACT|nr:hypothetical protein [Spirosoma foliorum]QMW06766.1 hypothetical protein H3H32_18670 [Spirosoma foliorum]